MRVLFIATVVCTCATMAIHKVQDYLKRIPRLTNTNEILMGQLTRFWYLSFDDQRRL